MKVAFVGTSHVHTPDYVDVCRSDPGVDVVGIAEADRDAPFVPPAAVPVLATPAALPPHDLCVVTTDIASHDAVLPRLQAPHLFVEKPLAVDAARARGLAARLEERADGTVHLGYFLRRHPVIAHAAWIVSSGQLGPIRHARLGFAHPGLREGWLSDWPAHRSALRMGYGTFGDLAIHLADLAGWMFDGVEPVACELDWPSGVAVDVQGLARLSGTGGARVELWAGGVADRVRLELSVQGERGEIALDEGVLRLRRGNAAEELAREVEPTPARGFRAVLDELRGRDGPPGALLADAIRANEVMDRLYAMAERS